MSTSLGITTPEEVALYLRKSISWVYDIGRNWAVGSSGGHCSSQNGGSL